MPAQPTLILFCGPPGSGKTTLARRLEAQGRGVRICTDDWQAALSGGHGDEEFHERLQVVLYEHARDLLRHGVDVILEDGLWFAAERAEKFAAARADGARIEWYVFEVPLEELWARLERRNSTAAPGAYPMTYAELARAYELFEPPTAAELASVDQYEIVSGGIPSESDTRH